MGPRLRHRLLAVLVVAALGILLASASACAAATSAHLGTPAASPSPAPFASPTQVAQRTAQWLDPTSAFARHAQDQLDAIAQHASKPLRFAQGYDFTNADTDGNPTTHEGYYVTLGIFSQGQQVFLAVGAVTAAGVRTPLIWSLANLPSLTTLEQDAAGTFPATPTPAHIAPADLLAFLGTPGHVVGLDLTASAYTPGVLPIIGALESKQPTTGLVPFQLPAPGQPLNAADYPGPTAVYTFPPYWTPPASVLAAPEAG